MSCRHPPHPTPSPSPQLVLVTVPAPHAPRYEAELQVAVRFLPYAAADAFFGAGGVAAGAAYSIDLGFTGGTDRYNGRYRLRAQTMGDAAVRARLLTAGLRVHDSTTVPAPRYLSLLGASRVWFATTEVGEHVSPRFFEVRR